MEFPRGIKSLPADISEDCRHNIKGGIDVVLYMLGCISKSRKAELEKDIRDLIESVHTSEAKRVILQSFKISY